ncbi:MAG: DUF881 domain-containing protein [Catenulisporales bacterium]|nr:DUF881 domain-containing protein [Catenulisporales bacterium]
MQTRPGSGAEPEKAKAEAEETADGAGEPEERDPFTPKVRPEGEGSAAADEVPAEDESAAEDRPEPDEQAESEPRSERADSGEPSEDVDSEAGGQAAADEAVSDAAEAPALRRRSAPGGQPQPTPRAAKRRIEPQRPHGRPPAAHAASDLGPRRRPASGPAAHAAEPKRRPPSEPKPAAAPQHPGHAAVAPTPTPAPVSLGRRRLFAALWPPRMSRNQVVVGVLLAALGAALAIQVHATNTSDQFLRAARSDDLVHILDDVTARGQRLDAELRDLQTQNAAIQNSADKAQAALSQAQQKARDLQILAGTVKAKGPGITMTINDPQSQLKAATLLNALEELRAAGAEVIQVDDVRVVVSSAFVDTGDGGILLDGRRLSLPYVFKVIGDPNTLAPAMQIPGGVVANVKQVPGASASITPGQVLVDAVAAQPSPDYAKAG